MHRIRVTRRGRVVTELALQGEVSIGRTVQNVLRLPEASVSSHHARVELTDEAIGRSLERTRRAGRAMGENVRGARDAEFPGYLPALAEIAVDGEGRRYVFPYVEDPGTGGRYPVDVYDSQGRLLLNGSLPFQGWDAHHGMTVFRIENDVVGNTARIDSFQIELPAATDR